MRSLTIYSNQGPCPSKSMNQLNRWQRIAIVVSLVWFGVWAYYFWQNAPTEYSVTNNIREQMREEERVIGAERDEARRLCDIEHKGNLGADMIAGCSKQAFDSHVRRLRALKDYYYPLISDQEASFPRIRLEHWGRFVALGLLVPLLLYIAVAWIARAPKNTKE